MSFFLGAFAALSAPTKQLNYWMNIHEILYWTALLKFVDTCQFWLRRQTLYTMAYMHFCLYLRCNSLNIHQSGNILSIMQWRHMGKWRYSSTSLDLSIRWRWVVIFTSQLVLLSGNEPQVLTEYDLYE
jgi:hypothetical protein